MNILVIGGGVNGLTTALRLRQRGHRVTVRAKAWAPDIVSSIAAAIWHPYQVAHPEATRWATVTAHQLVTLYDTPDAGVRPVIGCEYHRHAAPKPGWAVALRFHEPIPIDELPQVDGIVAGYRFEVPLIETPIYMRWLRDSTSRAGVTLETGAVTSFDEVPADFAVVVNCTGLGAVELVGDTTMFPIRGQIVKVAPGHVDRFLFDEENPLQPAYVIPRSDGTILGGTALLGDWDLSVRPEVTEAIRAHTSALHPALADAPILDVLVGLRPGRSQVRLELDESGARPVIHNYGHGGAGFTLSWGCADDVAQWVDTLTPAIDQ